MEQEPCWPARADTWSNPAGDEVPRWLSRPEVERRVQAETDPAVRVGGLYELAIGARYEREGYAVHYRGIHRGKGDRGIDLLCVRVARRILAQCKCRRAGTLLPLEMLEKFLHDCQAHERRKANPSAPWLPGFDPPEFAFHFITGGTFDEGSRAWAARYRIELIEKLGLETARPPIPAIRFSRRPKEEKATAVAWVAKGGHHPTGAGIPEASDPSPDAEVKRLFGDALPGKALKKSGWFERLRRWIGF